MPKYLSRVSYTVEGVKGLLKEGGSSRAAAIRRLIESRGGKVEAFYFATGEDDLYVITDLPSNVDGAALHFALAASGALRMKSVELFTPEEIDAATKQDVSYRAPGS